MHLFTENLTVELASYYRNLALGRGVSLKQKVSKTWSEL